MQGEVTVIVKACVLSTKKNQKQNFSSGPAAMNSSDLLVLMCCVTSPPPHPPECFILFFIFLFFGGLCYCSTVAHVTIGRLRGVKKKNKYPTHETRRHCNFQELKTTKVQKPHLRERIREESSSAAVLAHDHQMPADLQSTSPRCRHLLNEHWLLSRSTFLTTKPPLMSN